MSKNTKKKPTRSDLKRRLSDLDNKALLDLLRDLYAADKDNKTFLHARFALVDDVLEPYKTTTDRWVCSDVMSNHIAMFCMDACRGSNGPPFLRSWKLWTIRHRAYCLRPAD